MILIEILTRDICVRFGSTRSMVLIEILYRDISVMFGDYEVDNYRTTKLLGKLASGLGVLDQIWNYLLGTLASGSGGTRSMNENIFASSVSLLSCFSFISIFFKWSFSRSRWNFLFLLVLHFDLN